MAQAPDPADMVQGQEPDPSDVVGTQAPDPADIPQQHVGQAMDPADAATIAEEKPGVLHRLRHGAQFDFKGLDDPALKAKASEYTGVKEEELSDPEKYAHWNMARNAIMRGVKAADESGATRQGFQAAGQSAIGVRSIPGMVARTVLRGAAATGLDAAQEAYDDTRKDYYYQKAYDEQTALAGTVGQVVGTLADPGSWAAGLGAGKVLQGASAASPIASAALGTVEAVAPKASKFIPGLVSDATRFAGGNLAQRAVRAGAEGLAVGAVQGGLQSASEGGSLSDVAKQTAIGGTAGAIIGPAAVGLGAATKAGITKAAETEFGKAVMTRLSHFGTPIQSRLNTAAEGIEAVNLATGAKDVDTHVADIAEKVKAGGMAPDAAERLSQGGWGGLTPEEKSVADKILTPLDKAAAITKTEVKSIESQLKTYTEKAQMGLKRLSLGDAPEEGKMTLPQVIEAIGKDKADQYKIIALNDEKMEQGIDKAIALLGKDNTIAPEAKDAFMEFLTYQRDVFKKADYLAKTIGKNNTSIEGFMHRQLTPEAAQAKFAAEQGGQAIDAAYQRGEISRSSMERTRTIDASNVDDYLWHSVPDYIEHFAENHLKGKGGAYSLMASAKNLGGDLGALQKATVEAAEQAPGLADRAARYERALQEFGGPRPKPGTKEADVRHLNAAVSMHFDDLNPGASPLQKKLYMDAARDYISRTMNKAGSEEFLNVVRVAQRTSNAISPGALLSAGMDPMTMSSSGSITTAIPALIENILGISPKDIPSGGVQHIKDVASATATKAKEIASGIADKVMNPMQSVLDVAKGDWRQGLVELNNRVNIAQDSLHKLMDNTNLSSSLRDIAQERVNAAKYAKGMGQDTYQKAVAQAREMMSKPMGQRGEMPPELKRMTSLVMNEKLPHDLMGQAAWYNKLTKGNAGKFVMINQSFAANKLANTMRIAEHVLNTSTDADVRAHAAVALAQLMVGSLVIEHAFFQAIHEATNNKLTPVKEHDTALDRISNIAPFASLTRGTAPVIGKATGLVGEAYKEATEPAGFVTANAEHHVNPMVAKGTGFIPMAVKAYKGAKKMIAPERQPDMIGPPQ